MPQCAGMSLDDRCSGIRERSRLLEHLVERERFALFTPALQVQAERIETSLEERRRSRSTTAPEYKATEVATGSPPLSTDSMMATRYGSRSSRIL